MTDPWAHWVAQSLQGATLIQTGSQETLGVCKEHVKRLPIANHLIFKKDLYEIRAEILLILFPQANHHIWSVRLFNVYDVYIPY